jgi:hypothetical protein
MSAFSQPNEVDPVGWTGNGRTEIGDARSREPQRIGDRTGQENPEGLGDRELGSLSLGGRGARIAQAYRCLYGGAPEPQIPGSVSFLEAFVQVPLSAVPIFVLLLAIKNRFKIK